MSTDKTPIPALDDNDFDVNSPQFARQTNAKNRALLIRERIIIQERLTEIEKELEHLAQLDG